MVDHGLSGDLFLTLVFVCADIPTFPQSSRYATLAIVVPTDAERPRRPRENLA